MDTPRAALVQPLDNMPTIVLGGLLHKLKESHTHTGGRKSTLRVLGPPRKSRTCKERTITATEALASAQRISYI